MGFLCGLLLLFFLALVIPVVIVHEKERYQSYQKHSNGIVNHDASFRQFVYKTHKSSDEIWDTLKLHQIHTSVKYRFNDANQTIVFYSELPDGYLDMTYRIYVLEHEGYNILKVVQENHFLEKNKYALLQNEFWCQLLGATPIPYTQHPM